MAWSPARPAWPAAFTDPPTGDAAAAWKASRTRWSSAVDGAGLELGRQPAVDVDAPVGRDPVLHRRPHRLVHEPVVVGLAGGLDDLLPHGLVGGREEPVGGDLARPGDRVEGELGADDGGDGEELAGAGVHPAEPPGHPGVDRLGQGAGVDRGQAGADVAQQLGEEEGVALGPQPEGVDHRRLGEDAGHGVAGDAVEDGVGDVAVVRQVGQQRGHGVGPVDRRVAVGADDEHRAPAGWRPART